MEDTIPSIVLCNAILPRGVQHLIEKAAAYESYGNRFAAESCREDAGYGMYDIKADPR